MDIYILIKYISKTITHILHQLSYSYYDHTERSEAVLRRPSFNQPTPTEYERVLPSGFRPVSGFRFPSGPPSAARENLQSISKRSEQIFFLKIMFASGCPFLVSQTPERSEEKFAINLEAKRD